MVLEDVYVTFGGILSVYVWGYKLVSDIIVFLDDTFVFGTYLIIDNLEVDLVASQIEAVHYGVVGCNVILVLLGIEGWVWDCVVVAMEAASVYWLPLQALMRKRPVLSL